MGNPSFDTYYRYCVIKGVGISSSGGCSDRNTPTCTSLEQIREITVNGIVTLKTASGCGLTVTGGTEVSQLIR